jgi:hypothetical protein
MILQIETSFSMQRTLFGTEESEVEEFKVYFSLHLTLTRILSPPNKEF